MTEDGSVYKRIEVDQLDVTIKDGKVVDYRVRVKISFKYEKD
jgi:flavin-binding protein dodecin